jgi:GTPase SAR1 family protein
MSSSNSSPKVTFGPISKLVDIILGFVSNRVVAKINRTDRGVAILKKLHLISENPEPDFDSVYAYSLAEYGKGRPEAAKRLFRHKFIKSAFSKAFDQMNTSIVQIEAQNLPESSTISKEFQQMDCDPRNEIPVFVEIFYYMVQQTRTPAEVVRDQMLTDIKEVQEELGNKLIEAVNQLRGELDLSLNWFSYRFRKQLAGVGDKYIPELHTPTNIDEIVNAVLVDDSFVKALQGRFSRLAENYKMYSQVAHELDNPFPKQINWSESKHQVLEASNQLKESLNTALSTVKEAIEEILQYRLNKVRQVDWDTLKKDIDESGKNYGNIISKIDVKSAAYTGDESIHKHLIRELSNKLEEPKRQAEDFYDNLLEFIEQIDYLNSSYLHLIGSAGIGKTHLVTHICQSRLEKGQPSIFILGRHFTTGQPIHEQLKSILDIPTRYSWQEFLSSLSIVARAHKTRIPILIDGLNEATLRGEFSKIWKDDLREFISELVTYEELVLITTCRASYKDEIWPSNDDTNIIDMYGFDSLAVEMAIEKYFEYYKIRADLTNASTLQFEHPIYLRIFCESKNPKRLESVDVYIGEDTVFEIFDNYIDQANQRIVNKLGLHRHADVVSQTLASVANYLWEYRKRGIPLQELFLIADGTTIEEREWHQSKTQAIESEGLLVYRDLFEHKDIFYFSYDLLAGYQIAQYLLKQASSNLEEYINSVEIVSLLFSEDYRKLHPFCEDIRHALATLLPSKTGKYLHEFIDNEPAFSVSVDTLFEIPPHVINEKAVELLHRLFENHNKRVTLLQRMASTVSHINHPFNSRFLSSLLLNLTMTERDSCWTEYVRENAERFESIISRLENDCKNNVGFSRISMQRLCLVAEYVMWTLTSTVRPLRDMATRALYWFGRRFPGEFLELLRKSLDINDPYVPERMLAAAFGIVMAKQYDFNDPSFVQEFLPEYGRLFYDTMFSNEALYSTTHILARDYAKRTIDIALIHHPGLLNPEERERIKPPFTEGGIREWGESEYGKDGGLTEPIRMDFGNYTIGRLIEGRSNYDSQHAEYRIVLSNIYWRIFDLGYNPELFKSPDEFIAMENARRGRHDSRDKTDRYGKKYSWIAFYEMAGYRQDKGLLNDLYGAERISDADIDPSFPDDVPDYALITSDFLGDRETTTQDWILNGGLPDLSPYLVLKDLDGRLGSWVLLDGYINQEDPTIGRRRFIFPRGFLVDISNRDKLAERLESQDLAGRWLPEIPGDYYTFAGEFPWADTYPHNGLVELEFLIDQQIEDDTEEKLIVQKDGEPLSYEEWLAVLERAIRYASEKSTDEINHAIEEVAAELGYEAIEATQDVKRETPVYDKIEVLIPIREYTWESYHSDVNQASKTATLAREIAERMLIKG